MTLTRLEYLRKKYKILKWLLIIIPIIYGLIYSEFIKTKQELSQIERIELNIEIINP